MFPGRATPLSRASVLGGKFPLRHSIQHTVDTLMLCPGYICQSTKKGEELARTSSLWRTLRKNGLKFEANRPRGRWVQSVERIMQEAGIEVGGIEYVIDDRDGRLLYYAECAVEFWSPTRAHRRVLIRTHKLADYT